MSDKITREQFEELECARLWDMNEYHQLLKEYTGIVAKPYTAFSYYDSAGNYIGDGCTDDLSDLLKSAYVEVTDREL